MSSALLRHDRTYFWWDSPVGALALPIIIVGAFFAVIIADLVWELGLL
jgi:hypothetical protein